MTTHIALALETTAKRTFASAVDWPGLARSGKTESAAIEALLSYFDRYAEVAGAAGEVLASDEVLVEVVDASEGSASTDFGIPGRITESDRRPTSIAQADRLARLVVASWARLDATADGAPESLRKGSRGGGRDTSEIAEHARASDYAYAREIGLTLPAPTVSGASVQELRDGIIAIIREPSDGSPLAGRKWTVRYAAHRIAWHALDHAWEIEDRTEPARDQ